MNSSAQTRGIDPSPRFDFKMSAAGVLYSPPMDSPSSFSFRARQLMRRVKDECMLSFLLSVLESEQVESIDSMDEIDKRV